MGYFRHHAIVVTGCGDDIIEAARTEALRVFEATPAKVTSITPAGINGYRSFLVAPDGSKEGWGDSDRTDAAREQFVAWLRDGSSTEWAEVEFGGDDRDMMGLRGAYGDWTGRVDDGA